MKICTSTWLSMWGRALWRRVRRGAGFYAPLFLLLLMAAPARAQFLGYTFPQTVTQTLTPAAGAVCNSANQIYNVTNLGQTVHFVSFVFAPFDSQFTIWIQGVDASGGVNIISDIGTPAAVVSTLSGVVAGVGYYAQVQVVVNCTGNGRYTVNYSGTSASVPTEQGAALGSTVSKEIAAVAPAGTTAGLTFTPPFGSTQGYLMATYIGAGSPSGSTLQVSCLNTTGLSGLTQTWTLAATAATIQLFPVAAQTCAQIQVRYVTGGTSTATVTVFYNFTPPGFPQEFAYSHISTNTSTQAKTGPGQLHAITINNPGSTETITAFDNTACSGTTIAVLTPAAAEGSVIFDVNFQTGLCITTAGTTAGDTTVSFN